MYSASSSNGLAICDGCFLYRGRRKGWDLCLCKVSGESQWLLQRVCWTMSFVEVKIKAQIFLQRSKLDGTEPDGALIDVPGLTNRCCYEGEVGKEAGWAVRLQKVRPWNGGRQLAGGILELVRKPARPFFCLGPHRFGRGGNG